MAGSKVNDFSIGDSNIQSVMLTLDKTFKGLHQVSLTNYDNTSESQIAAGSVVENNGALYKFDSNESITGSPSDGTVYIRLVPSGDTITAEYTNTAPTWSDSKQGWYGTGADANKRYLEFVITLNSSTWKYKEPLNIISKNRLNSSAFVFADGTQTITTTAIQNIVFDGDKCLYNCEYNASDQIKVLDKGFYAISARINLYGVTTGITLTLTANQSTLGLRTYMDIDSDSSTTTSHIYNGNVFLEANDLIYFTCSSTTTPNATVTSAFLNIRKIGE